MEYTYHYNEELQKSKVREVEKNYINIIENVNILKSINQIQTVFLERAQVRDSKNRNNKKIMQLIKSNRGRRMRPPG